MKKIITIAAAILLFITTTNSQDTTKTDALLSAATVYFGYGAELTHNAKVASCGSGFCGLRRGR